MIDAGTGVEHGHVNQTMDETQNNAARLSAKADLISAPRQHIPLLLTCGLMTGTRNERPRNFESGTGLVRLESAASIPDLLNLSTAEVIVDLFRILANT